MLPALATGGSKMLAVAHAIDEQAKGSYSCTTSLSNGPRTTGGGEQQARPSFDRCRVHGADAVKTLAS